MGIGCEGARQADKKAPAVTPPGLSDDWRHASRARGSLPGSWLWGNTGRYGYLQGAMVITLFSWVGFGLGS